MKRVCLVAIAASLAVILVAGEALAWRGRRSGSRTGAATSGRRPATTAAPGGNRLTPGLQNPTIGQPHLAAPTLPDPPGIRPSLNPAGTTGPRFPGGGNWTPGSGTQSFQQLFESGGITGNRGDWAQQAQQAVAGWSGLQYQPFSPAWYAQHPNAWKLTHAHADAFAAATAAGLATWLAVPVATTGGTSVVYSESGSGETASTQQQADEAAELAATGAVDPPADTQWMTIGVFAFQPLGQTEASRVLQLAVSPDGILRGVQYDLLSDHADNVYGAVDKSTQRVSWRIGETSQVVFQTVVAELTRPEGRVTAYFPDGRATPWQLRPIQPPTEQ